MATECEENVLVEYVNLMAKAIDTDIDPCENFMKYACGNFSLDNYDQKHGEYPPNRYGDPYDRILENETINYPSLTKARNFYKSYEDDVGKLLRNEGLKEFCGGFPAFDDGWTSENFDWIKTAAILGAMNIPTVFSYSIRYQDDATVFQISAEICGEEVVDSAEELLRKIDISDDRITEIINDVKLVREMSQLQAPESSEKELREQLFNRFFEIAAEISIKDDDLLDLDCYDVSYIQGLLNIFSDIEPKSVANYIMCLAVYKFQESSIFSIIQVLSTNYFAPAIVAAGYSDNWNSIEEEKRQEIRKRFLNSKDEFKLDELAANADMDCDKIVSNYIATNYEQSQVDMEYENLEIDPENFFQNILNIIKHGATDSAKRYFSTSEEDMQYKIIQLIQEIVNTSKKPMLFHFSGWELEMLREVAYCFGLDKDSTEYELLSDCLTKQMATFDIPEESNIVKMCISTIQALKLAFKDYQNWLSENESIAQKQAELLEKLNLTNNQAFFVSFAQHFCGVEHVSSNVALLSLLNSDEFAQEFGINRSN